MPHYGSTFEAATRKNIHLLHGHASEPHLLVTTASRDVARCHIKWEDWFANFKTNEACSFAVHRSQQFPAQDIFLSVWQLVYEGSQAHCEDILPTSLLDIAQTRTTLLVYRVTANRHPESSIQDVIDLSHAIAQQMAEKQPLTESWTEMLAENSQVGGNTEEYNMEF